MSLRRRKLGLIIPAHNEELAIEATIRSAIRSGQPKPDIFIVDDDSNDRTTKIASDLLGSDHVLTVKRSGKAGAVKKAIQHFDIENKYSWLHISDGDSIFGPTYFSTFRSALDENKYVAATGFVQSLRGDWISKFRVFEYTLGFAVIRRIQSALGMISVIPGPTSALRTDVIKYLNFETGSLTEDFDITMQIHRKKLGKIQYIPRAVTYTQDPLNFSDYVAQVSRWYRGFFQGVVSHKLGLKLKRIDLFIWYAIGQSVLYGADLLILLPYALGRTYNINILARFFLAEIFVYFVVALGCAIYAKRLDSMAAFPFFYFLRLVNLFLFYQAFVEVVIFRKFQEKTVGWSTEGRRYEFSSADVN
ncbi:MAG: glycosyltransferase [Candidatus Saccharimonadia bacterium]